MRNCCTTLFILLNSCLPLTKSFSTSSTSTSSKKTIQNAADSYALYWEHLLSEEYQEHVQDLKLKRKTWSPSRLEASGMSIFKANAESDTELYGEKIVRIYKYGETNLRNKFNRGDVLVLTPEMGYQGKDPMPREGLVVDVGKDWLTMGVGASWPQGLWEMRKHAGAYLVRIDRTAPQAPMKAQKTSLQRVRKGIAGDAAKSLAELYVYPSNAQEIGNRIPSHFNDDNLQDEIQQAMDKAVNATSFQPNESQKGAILWALQKNIAMIRGPPGTGKTRVAALLISTVLRMSMKPLSNDDSKDDELKVKPRVLAVTHSNGAADVLLEALLQMNVPAVRSGRPASVSSNVQHRTIIAISEKMPEVVRLRQEASNMENDSQTRQAALFDVKRYISDVQDMITKSAPVVVTSCIGAQQLCSSDEVGVEFPIVVLDEAAQTTEPALVCALSASKSRQVILVGDTRQLPPTVTSQNPELRKTIGVSPMARLEKIGVPQFTLKEQYRMPPALLAHPSTYFYEGLVKCAQDGVNTLNQLPPLGFPWPNTKEPLAFINVGKDSEVAHNFGGRSNPKEAEVIMGIVRKLILADEIDPRNISIITPYSKQVQILRSELSNNSIYKSQMQHIKVGTVDSFQGQETDVVIFSAVRSNQLKELGFLRDSRRLNVAITRAKRGLIIVGDQTVLRTCRHWAALLDSCSDRGCTMDELDLTGERGLIMHEVSEEDEDSDPDLDMDDDLYGLF